MFQTVVYFRPSLIIAGKAEGGLLALPENSRLGWKWLTVPNTLAYYGIKLKISMRSFTSQGVNIIDIFSIIDDYLSFKVW